MQQAIRRVLRKLLNKAGYDVRKFFATNGPELNLLDMAVRLHLTKHDDLFVFQIGANDGLCDDPLQGLIREFRLPGLLVEPVPQYFEELCSNYADQPQLYFEEEWQGTGTLCLTMVESDSLSNNS